MDRFDLIVSVHKWKEVTIPSLRRESRVISCNLDDNHRSNYCETFITGTAGFIHRREIDSTSPTWARPTWAVQIRPAAASYFNHCAPERNLPEFWLRNWTPTSYRVIRRVIRKCIRRLVEPSNPRMSSLPTVRFRAEQQQCSGSEVHFFAPLYVNVKQSTVKILSCIFTCMVTRVVHIEIVHSMDASSFISALRRFINCRGRPVVIYSDKGMNLTAGKILREAMKAWDPEYIGSATHFE